MAVKWQGWAPSMMSDQERAEAYLERIYRACCALGDVIEELEDEYPQHDHADMIAKLERVIDIAWDPDLLKILKAEHKRLMEVDI